MWRYFLISVFLVPSSVFASGVDAFAQRSQVKGALVEGDCLRYGGVRYVGDIVKLSGTLSRRGAQVSSYRNVKRYRGKTYVMWSYSNTFVSGVLEYCVFD